MNAVNQRLCLGCALFGRIPITDGIDELWFVPMRHAGQVDDAVADGVFGIAGLKVLPAASQLFLSGSLCQVIFGADPFATTVAA